MDGKRELIEALVELRGRAATAAVEIVDGALKTRLVLSGGRVVRVEDGAPAEPLGRMLVRQGHLTQDQYIDTLERMTETISAGERVRFGELAVQLGYVDETVVRRALNDQVRWRALRALSRPSPRWVIDEVEQGPASGSVAMHVEDLVLASLRWTDDAQKRALVLESLWHERVGQAWSWDEIETRFDLATEESRFVRRALTGDLTVEGILGAPDAADVDAPALLAALLVTGAAVSRVDSRETLARLFDSGSPPRRETREPGDVGSWEIEEPARVRDKVQRARLVKASVPPRPLGDIEQRLRAEQAFQRGRARLKGDRVGEAVKHFLEARALDGSCPEYALYAAWAEHRSSGQMTMGAKRPELVRLALEAQARQPTLALPVFVLAEAAREEGDDAKAEEHVRLVRRLEPQFFDRGGSLTRPSTPDAIEAAAREAARPPHAPEPLPEPLPPPAVASSPSLVTVTAPPPALPRRTRPVALVAALLALVGVAAAATVALRPRAETTAAPTTTTAPAPAPTPTPAPAPAPTPTPTPEPTPAPAPAAVATPEVDARSGLLLLSASALGHRVFVDGKLVGDAKPSLPVACGDHKVKIGSRGREVSLTVPCGGSVKVP